MAAIPLFGTGIGRKSPNVSVQARINLYAEKLAEPDKATMVFYARPGIRSLNLVTPAPPLWTGAARGLIAVQSNNGTAVPPSDYLYQFCGTGTNTYTSLNNATGASMVDPITGTGPVRAAYDGNAVCAVNGIFGYHVSVISGLTYKNPDPNFPNGAQTVTFLGGRFYADDPLNPGRFRWSDLYNDSSWPSLNFATAESNPDPLTGVFEAHGQLLLFGTRTTEFWSLAAAGFAAQQPVQNVPGSTIMWGCEAYDTIRKIGDRVMFMGRNNNGDRKVLMLDGYKASVVSTPDIEADIQNVTAPDTATAIVIGKAGHTFYVLNLPTLSWAYDLETGNWDIWQTTGSRFAGQWSAAAFGEVVLADYASNKLYTMRVDQLTDDGATMVREITSRHLFGPDLERLPVSEIVVDMETGVGRTAGEPGDNPQAMLTWSKDGGHTYGNEIWQPMGKVGKYLTRTAWRFLGISRDWTFKLRITDPVTTALIGANMKVGP